MLLSSLEKSYSAWTEISQEQSCLQWFFCLCRCPGAEKRGNCSLGEDNSSCQFSCCHSSSWFLPQIFILKLYFFFPYETNSVSTPVFRNVSQMLLAQVFMQSFQTNKYLFVLQSKAWVTMYFCNIWYTCLDLCSTNALLALPDILWLIMHYWN